VGVTVRTAIAFTVASLVAAGSGGAATQPAGHLVRLTATPGLFPPYAPAIHDYVIRCAGRPAVTVSTWSAAGTTALIQGKARRTAKVAIAPGRALTVAAHAAGGTSSYHVRCLPADFPSFQVSGPGAPSRLYVSTPSLALGGMDGHYVVIFDNHGVPVWWYRDAGTPIDAKLLPGHLIAYATFNGADPAYQVRRLDGTLVSHVRSPDGEIDDHELQTTSDGNDVYLVYQPKHHVDITSLGGPVDATVLEGRIEEVSPNGKLVWSWSTDGHVDPSESIAWAKPIVAAPIDDANGTPQYDVYHANSVSISGNLVVVSMRYENAIFGIDKKTGAVLWKLGGTPTAKSLTVIGDPHPTSPFSGQHDARILADGTVSLFDDQSFTGQPRAVQFKIDTNAGSATLLRSLSDPTINTSSCCGSARVLSDGNWLVSWGGDPTFGEYGADGTPLLRIQFGGLFSYRAVPVAMSKLPVAALREGMDELAGDDND
jgi:uncharacterized protein YndB with AHSA1/START domain